MTDREASEGHATGVDAFLGHPVRAGLMRLLREQGTVTSTDAARELGRSSGLCSFHLRQLARRGYIEEVEGARGRVRPWRLRGAAPAAQGGGAELGRLARGLEDESYQRWLEHRDRAPVRWRRDEAFSAVLYLTPEEMGEVAGAVRDVLSRHADREHRPALRPADAAPVAVMVRLFPLLPARDGGDA